MIHISQQAELHLMKLKDLCVGAELSQGLSAKPAVPAIAFLSRAALLTVLVGQVDLLSGGKVFSSCWSKEYLHVSAFIFQGHSELRCCSLFPWIM